LSGRCDDGHCVTCSDEGVPMRVVEVRDGALALCEDGSEVMTDLVADVKAGDVLLCHAGVALQQLTANAERLRP
jgi:hydrogenase expression/formation protein HypC